MKFIDLINKIYKEEVEVGFQFTLRDKEFTKNTYEIRKCGLGLMIWDLDNDSRFDSNEYILDYLDWNVEIIEEEKEIEELKLVGIKEFKIMSPEERYHVTAIEYDKINELIREVNIIKNNS